LGLQLQVEPIEERHVEPYVRLACREYGSDVPDAQPAHVRWKFLQNPQGVSIGIHLYEGGELVGRMAATPRRFLQEGKTYTAAYIVDLLVHRKHRGMIALLQLVEGLEKLAGFDFVMVIMPNQAGSEVWEKFAKLPRNFELDVAVVPLRPAKLLRKWSKRVPSFTPPVADLLWRGAVAGLSALGVFSGRNTVQTSWPCASEIEDMLSAAWGEPASGERTPAFMEWRFRRSPVWKYDICFLRDHGRLSGYFATRRTVYNGYDSRFVVDAFGRPELKRSEWAGVLRRLSWREALGNADMIVLIGNNSCGRLWAVPPVPFLTVPHRFLPRNTTVFAKWLSKPAFSFRPGAFRLTLADSDLV